MAWVLVGAPALTPAQTTYAPKVAIGTADTSSTASVLHVVGLGGRTPGQGILSIASGDVFAGALGTADIPTVFTRRDLAESISLAWTFGAGLTANGPVQINSTLGVTGLTTAAKVRTSGLYGTANPLVFRNSADSADVATWTDAGLLSTTSASLSSTLGVGGLSTLTGGFTAGAASQVNATLGITGLTTAALIKTTGVYGVTAPFTILSTGGSGTPVVETFTGSATWVRPSGVTQVDVLVVGGGGGGGSRLNAGGGGGGGGGYRSVTGVAISGNVAITVGAGGAGAGSGAAAQGGDGGASSFGALVTTVGGGGGGKATTVADEGNGRAGGSGGGSGGNTAPGKTGGAGTAGQGFAGGASTTDTTTTGGAGGGGAGAVGGTGGTSSAGAGGAGLTSSISGSSVGYAGGGAGAGYDATATHGGGAGSGSTTGVNGAAGTANRGGGGGGGGQSGAVAGAGGNGGSGIVYVSYILPAAQVPIVTFPDLTDAVFTYGGVFGGDVAVNGGDLTSTASTLTIRSGGLIDLEDETTLTGVPIRSDNWASWTTGWAVDALGSADFRRIQADELHVRLFIAELQEAHNGAELWVKSTAVLHTAFNCPASSTAVTIRVKDFPSADNLRVFSAGDWVLFRPMSRTDADNDGNTDLIIGECVGQVTAYADGTGGTEGTQTWTFTRGVIGGTGGSLSSGTAIQDESLALDFGVSGAGFLEATVNDGAEGIWGPYFQSVKWTGSPASAAGGKVVTSRFGKLTGITGVADEYGFIAGLYAGSDGRYVKASNLGLDLHGVDLTIWDGASEAFRLRRNAGAPYFSMGAPAPTTYGSGTGLWMGEDASVYKFRVGNPAASWFSATPTNVDLSLGATPFIRLDASYGVTVGVNLTGNSHIVADLNGNLALRNGAVNRILLAAANGALTLLDRDGVQRVKIDATQSVFGVPGTARVTVDHVSGYLTLHKADGDIGVHIEPSAIYVGNPFVAGRALLKMAPTLMEFCNTGVGCPLTFDGVSGNITSAGSITLSSASHIKAGATAYAAGTGFWLGLDAGTPKFYLGNGTTLGSSQYLTWSGSQLTLSGAMVAVGTTRLNTGSLTDTTGNLTIGASNTGTKTILGVAFANTIEINSALMRPVSDAQTILGTAALRFSNIHLALGAAITNGTNVVVLDPAAPSQLKHMAGWSGACSAASFTVQGGVITSC